MCVYARENVLFCECISGVFVSVYVCLCVQRMRVLCVWYVFVLLAGSDLQVLYSFPIGWLPDQGHYWLAAMCGGISRSGWEGGGGGGGGGGWPLKERTQNTPF